MIEVFKILHGYYANIIYISLLPHVDVATMGNKYKLYHSSVKYDLRKHFFTNRVVSLWNSLPDGVVDSDTINCFKSRLDKFWTIKMFYITGKPTLLGPGNEVYVRCVFSKMLLKFNGDEDTDIEALCVSVNFRSLVLSCLVYVHALKLFCFAELTNDYCSASMTVLIVMSAYA